MIFFSAYCPPVATTRRPRDFAQLLDQIEAEAHEEGPVGEADLRALQIKYAMVHQILERRRELHWTQKQLAEKAGIGQAVISRIERGRLSPTIDTYARLATALGFTPNFQPGRWPDPLPGSV
jgi:ribosome-binding protein aMBF1 (putative translation factor)